MKVKRKRLEEPKDSDILGKSDEQITEFRAELRIDKHSLDDAIVSQPHLFFRVSEVFTEKMNDRDVIKDRLDRLSAKLDQAIRVSAADTGDKITETSITTEITFDTQYKDLRDRYLQAKYICETWALLKDAFNQRSYMLRDLVNLYLANYYSDVSERQVTTGPVGDKRADALQARSTRARIERRKPKP